MSKEETLKAIEEIGTHVRNVESSLTEIVKKILHIGNRVENVEKAHETTKETIEKLFEMHKEGIVRVTELERDKIQRDAEWKIYRMVAMWSFGVAASVIATIIAAVIINWLL